MHSSRNRYSYIRRSHPIEVQWRLYLRKFTFELKHKYFAAHRALKLEEDDEEAIADAEQAGFTGRVVDLVIEPLMLRYGDADGESLDSSPYRAQIYYLDGQPQ